MATEWQLSRHGDRCTACGRSFEPSESFQAVLLDGQAGYERCDYCTACVPNEHPGVIGTWRTKRPAGDTRAPIFDREAVTEFFGRLDGAAQPEKVQFRFVLGLLLWRKKVLKFEETIREEDAEIWRFKAVRDGSAHSVRRPDLSEEEIERLSESLDLLLTGGNGESGAAAVPTIDAGGTP